MLPGCDTVSTTVDSKLSKCSNNKHTLDGENTISSDMLCADVVNPEETTIGARSALQKPSFGPSSLAFLSSFPGISICICTVNRYAAARSAAHRLTYPRRSERNLSRCTTRAYFLCESAIWKPASFCDALLHIFAALECPHRPKLGGTLNEQRSLLLQQHCYSHGYY